MTHPYKHILIAIANGEQIQWQSPTGSWIDAAACDVLCDVANHSEPLDVYRIKPRTINWHEVPEPVREPLKNGQRYYLADIALDDGVTKWSWDDDEADSMWLNRGLIHLTEEAAKRHYDALLSFTKIQKED